MAFFYENRSYEDNREDTCEGESDERENATRASNRRRYFLAGVMLVTVVLVLFICLPLLIVEKETTVQGQDRGDGRPSQAIEKGKVYLMSNVSHVWGGWSNWFSCSVTCGSGKQTRTRQCYYHTSKVGKEYCEGSVNESKNCNRKMCPVCSEITPCGSGATCIKNNGVSSCRCNEGFKSINGSKCSDINECYLSSLCGINATCVNTIGSYVCRCDPGYTGDGLNCTDLNECEAPSNDCDPNASCNNTIGSHTCTCNKAYFGDGKSCVKKRQYGLESSLILKHYGNTIYYLDTLYRYLKPVIQHAATNRWVRCWRARTDGWASRTFHIKCDGKGPTVTIIRVGTYVFGGYTDKSWHIRGEYSSSSRSFLYTLHNGKGYYPIKLTLTGRLNHKAIYGNSGYGPTFR